MIEKIENIKFKKSGPIKSIKKIPGDASLRKYYRICTAENTFILMLRQPFLEEGEDLPFLEIQRYLSQAKIDVPRVFESDPKQGYILLEDLGDVTLLHRLKTVSDMEVEEDLYRKVIRSLVHLHFEISPRKEPFSSIEPIPAFKERFDFEKLMWEVDFTIQHFFESQMKRSIEPKDLKIIRDQMGDICSILEKEPQVFCHRDFHSRNIMVSGERLVFIDFQDARMGPAQYDLASLLKDSYYQLERAPIERLVQYYIRTWEEVSGEKIKEDHFFYIFDLMSIQRNFKAIGSFASFLNRRKNPTYLKYIGNTFENIRRVLLRYPQYKELREVLFHYYYF